MRFDLYLCDKHAEQLVEMPRRWCQMAPHISVKLTVAWSDTHTCDEYDCADEITTIAEMDMGRPEDN